jgi:hypothetical protein
MEILRFIKWQWGQIHRNTKQVTAIVLFVLLCSWYSWYIGLSFIFVVLTIGGSAILGMLFLGLYEETSNAWRKYKRIKAEEAEKIMRKLRGNDGSVTTPGKGFF